MFQSNVDTRVCQILASVQDGIRTANSSHYRSFTRGGLTGVNGKIKTRSTNQSNLKAPAILYTWPKLLNSTMMRCKINCTSTFFATSIRWGGSEGVYDRFANRASRNCRLEMKFTIARYLIFEHRAGLLNPSHLHIHP